MNEELLPSTSSRGSSDRKVSFLHKAVQLNYENRAEIIQLLIESNLVDCDLRDESGLTASEYALAKLGDRNLAKVMISAEMKKLDSDELSFYVMIRRGSVELYKLFLEVTELNEERIFYGVSNAMIEINVKRIVIQAEMKVFLQFQLVHYAHSKLVGDVEVVKDPNEWRTHFAEIEGHRQVLKEKFEDRSYTNIDEEFLYRVKMIHNHLYFIKDKRFLRNLPMMQTTFCLAVFVSIFENRSEYQLFRFIINKLNVIQYVDTIGRQLNKIMKYMDALGRNLIEKLSVAVENIPKTGKISQDELKTFRTQLEISLDLQENVVNIIISGIKNKIEPALIVDKVISNEIQQMPIYVSGKDKSVLNQLKRTYFRAKQLYSIDKCLVHINVFNDDDDEARPRLKNTAAIKRLVQVLGEATKSTKNSPNLPKIIEERLVGLSIDTNPEESKIFREFFSHKYSLVKHILGDQADLYLRTVPNGTISTALSITVLLIFSVVEYSRTFLGAMKRCRHVCELMSLLEYASNFELLDFTQTEPFERAEDLIIKLKKSQLRIHKHLSDEQLLQLLSISTPGAKVIERIKGCFIQNWLISFQDIKSACLANAPMSAIQRMIDWNLSSSKHSKMSPEVLVGFMADRNEATGTMSSMLNLAREKLIRIENEECFENTKQIIENLGLKDHSPDLVNHLHNSLGKFYENIFCIDTKYQTIKRVFKTFGLPLDDELVDQMRKHDKKELQDIFNHHVEAMRDLLEKCGITSIDDLLTRAFKVPDEVKMALEYYQLELCEMLISVGIYGDNFSTLKHRVPLIYGRNYRNYLAHDSLSYNVLTDSSRIMVVINAMVFVTSSVKLFATTTKPNFKASLLPSKTQTLDWTLESLNLNWTNAVCLSGPSDTQQNSNSNNHGVLNPNCMTIIFKKCPTILESSFSTPTPNSTVKDQLNQKKFREAFRVFASHSLVKNSTLPQELFGWNPIIDHLLDALGTSVDGWNERDCLGRTVLHRLIQAGNCEMVEELLRIMPDIDVNAIDSDGRSHLDYAMAFGCSKCTKYLLEKNAKVSGSNQLMGILLHMNESLPLLFEEFFPLFLGSQSYTKVAVYSNNMTALQLFVHEDEDVSFGISTAAIVNRDEMLKFLVTLPNVDYTSESINYSLNIALHRAIENYHPKIVKLLLDYSVSPNWINPAVPSVQTTALHMAAAKNCPKLVKMMHSVDRNLYLTNTQLEHPMQIAVEINSKKMVRCLTRLGFSLLDSGRILCTAVCQDHTNIVEKIFQDLDQSNSFLELIDDSLLKDIAKLLNQWRTMAYLEESDSDRQIALAVVVRKKNVALLDTLLKRCEEARKFEDSFLHSMSTFRDRKQTQFFCCDQIVERESVLQLCDTVLNELRNSIRFQSVESTISITFMNGSNYFIFRGTFKIIKENESDPNFTDINIEETIDTEFDESLIENKVFEIILDQLKIINQNIFGTFFPVSTPNLNFFLIMDSCAYLFQNDNAHSKYSLNALVNFANSNGFTPLHSATLGNGGIEIVELLLKYGANPENSNSKKQNLLHASLLSRNTEVTNYLLKLSIDQDLRSTFDREIRLIDAPDDVGLTPLHIASLFGETEVVRILLNFKVDTRAKDDNGMIPLMYATFSSNLKIMKILLDSDPDQVNISDRKGQTIVHYSVKQRKPKMLQLLLQYNVDFGIANVIGETPIQMALKQGVFDWIKILLDFGKSNGIPGLLDLNSPPILYTVFSQNDVDFIRSVVEYEIGADLNDELSLENLEKLKNLLTRPFPNESIPLHVSAFAGSTKTCAFILDCQKMFNQYSNDTLNFISDYRNKNGATPLDLALEGKHEKVVNLFVENL